LGTSLQIRPCRDLPRKTKKNGGRIVIVNLQKTTMDSLANLIIHERCDRVMKYIMDKLNLNSDEKPSQISLFNPPKYSHVKKVILLSGKSKSGKDYLGKNLAENLPGLLLLHINENSSNRNEDSTLFCQKILEENDQLCSSSSIWIINDIKYPNEYQFFKKIFDNRVLFVRIEASNDTRQKRGWNDELDIDESRSIPCEFVFSNNGEDNFIEQMNNLIKFIHLS
jgi:hypothetical protein